jgi:putative membrane protein
MAAVVSAAPAGAQGRWGDGWDSHPFGMIWGLWGLGMMLGMLVFWGLVVVALVLGIRWLLRQGPGRDDAMRVLRERYARGEIDREEYMARKRDLGG